MNIQEVLGHPYEVSELLELESLVSRIGLEDVVYLSGSKVDGTGNLWSDADVYIVGELQPKDGSRVLEGAALIANHLIGSLRVDFEFWSNEALKTLREKLSSIDLTAAALTNDMLPSYGELVYLHRLSVGLPLANQSAFRKLQTSIDFEKVKACRLRQIRIAVDDAFEDLAGMLESKDNEVALFRARDLLSFSLDAILASLGNTNPNPKWRVKIAHGLKPSLLKEDLEVLEEYWMLMYPDLAKLRQDAVFLDAYFTSVLNFSHMAMDRIYG